MLVSDLLATVDRLAPFELAEPWDRVGLLVGSRAATVTSVVVALDPNEAALDEAARLNAEVVLCHHPLFFDPLPQVTDDAFAGRLALRAVREGRALIAAHTNLDKARGGLGDIICAALDLEGVTPLLPARMDWCKLVGFVPEGEADDVRQAIFAAGAGVIGDYIHCSFSLPGEGTFLGTEGTRPAVGKAGAEHRTGELRLEAVFPRAARRRVTDAFVAAHSYEEPAFDVYPVENEVRSQGLGRLGYLKAPQALEDFARSAAGLFGLPAVRFVGDAAHLVRRVAVMPGSGASAIDPAVGLADVLLTGDVKYHDADRAGREGLALVEVPHEISEGFALERWTQVLADALRTEGVEVTFCEQRRPLWQRLTVEAAGDETAAEREGLVGNHADDYVHLYVDGGARGNPGPAAIGGRLVSAEGGLLEEFADRIGEATNNVAEYQALITGLELALDRGVRKLTVFSDSELVVKQVSGDYKVKDQNMKTFHEQARILVMQFQEFEIKAIRREDNTAADRLVNQALDEGLR
jgi:dinuclear metal center YbgI/SA1388 family protein